MNHEGDEMELGRLEGVEVRTVWEHEARDFTPWLLDHADHLAETLGIDLELNQSEHPVGGFLLDLVGRDLTNDAVLIVEIDGTDEAFNSSDCTLWVPLEALDEPLTEFGPGTWAVGAQVEADQTCTRCQGVGRTGHRMLQP